MKKLIKDFKVFPTGSYAYNVSREIKSEEDVIQLSKEITKEYMLECGGSKNGRKDRWCNG